MSLLMLGDDAPFMVYAHCTEVIYDGRASSTLTDGNYIILYKRDHSLLIHGAENCTPLNYMPSGATITIDRNGSGCIITATRKNEIIKITINEILDMRILDDWTSAKIKIRKTEQELKKKIKNDPIKYLGILPNETYEEYQTEQGPVDLLFCMTSFGDPDNTLHVVEVKRGKINVNNLVQLEKYLGCLYEDKVAYIAAPDIGVKAQKYCEKNSITYVCVDFD